MDYQFVHSVVKEAYVDLPAARPAPGACLKELRKYAGLCDCLDNDIGECYSFVTLRNASEYPIAFFSRTARKKNAVSVCKYLHCAGWECRDDLLLRAFDQVLQYPFFTEEQLDAFADANRPVPAEGGRLPPKQLRPLRAHPDAIRAVLYGAMLRWQQGAPQVHIGVPKEEMGRYNEYVLSAVREIYSYFPANMRSEIGFSSYLLPSHERDFPLFSIIFVPYQMADARTVMLDGSTPNAYATLTKSTGLKALDKMLDHIVRLPGAKERQDFFSMIYKDLENDSRTTRGKGVSPIHYSIVGDALSIMEENGSVTQKINSWAGFSANKQRYPAELRGQIDRSITGQLKPEEVVAYAKEKLGGASGLDSLANLVDFLCPLCAERPACAQALWGFFTESAERHAERPDQLYQTLEKNREAWSRLCGEAEYRRQMARWSTETVLALERSAEEKIRAQAESCGSADDLKHSGEAVIKQFADRAAPFHNPEQQSLAGGRLSARLRGLMNVRIRKDMEREEIVELKTADVIRREMKAVTDLNDLLPADKNAEEQAIQDKLIRRYNELKSLLDSEGTAFQELLRALQGTKEYFESLRIVSDKAGGLSKLNLETVRQLLAQRRPVERDAYFGAYARRYGTPLTFRALSDKPDFFRETVNADLRAIYETPQPLQLQGMSTESLVLRLNEMEKEAEMFGANKNFRVSMNGYKTEAAKIKQVASLKTDGAMTGEVFGAIAERLLAAGVFTAPRLKKLMTTAKNCGADLLPLIGRVLSGSIPGMGYDDYVKFLPDATDALVEANAAANRFDAYQLIQRTAFELNSRPEEADRALKKCKPVNSRKRKTLIAVALAALVLLGGGGWLAWRLLSPKPDEPVDTVDRAEQIQKKYDASCGNQNEKIFRLNDQELTDEDLKTVAGFYTKSMAISYDQLSEVVRQESDLLDELGYLTVLDLSGNSLEKLDELSACLGLRRLNLDGNRKLKDITPLDSLAELELLSLRNTAVEDEKVADFCQAHPGCFVLWTKGDETLVSVSGSTYIQGSASWDLSDQGLERLFILEENRELFTGLKALMLADNPLSDVTPLTGLQALEYVDLSRTELNDDGLRRLAAMQNLRVLRAEDNPQLTQSAVQEIKEEDDQLALICTRYSTETTVQTVEFAGESYDRKTETLDLHGKNLGNEDLKKLAELGFHNLRHLDLSDNNISDFSELTKLGSLEWLDISGNQAENLISLGSVSNLKVLYAKDNPLNSLGFNEYYNLSELIVLGVSSTVDGDVLVEGDGSFFDGIEWLPKLELLDLGALPNASLEQLIEKLHPLRELRVIHLDAPGEIDAEILETLASKGLYVDPCAYAPPVEEPVEEPAEEPIEEPAEESDGESDEASDGESGENSDEKPGEESDGESDGEPDGEDLEEPSEDLSGEGKE